MYLTPEAKSKLSNTIRSLRERLLTDFHNAVDSAYRLSLPLSKAGLSEEQRLKRQRLEQWLEEQSRSETKSKKEKKEEVRQRYLKTAEKLAAATLLNRLVAIKQMEAHGLIKPAVVTGGWQSSGYREFRDFAPELLKDETEGYGTLLQLLYDELALEFLSSYAAATAAEKLLCLVSPSLMPKPKALQLALLSFLITTCTFINLMMFTAKSCKS